MRARLLFITSLSSFALALDATAKEAVRTLQAELSQAESAQFAVENLAGTISVGPGGGSTVQATATIHARIPELAALVRFERVSGENGLPTLRVLYPLELHQSYRYPHVATGGGLLLGLFTGNPIRSEYEGTPVAISDRRGVLLYVDLDVRVPSRTTAARFRTVVGAIEGHALSGNLRFETSYGGLTLAQIHGDAVADTGSGSVSAKDMTGSFKCDAGNGDCAINGFSGDGLTCITTTGEVGVMRATAHMVAVDTGSGHVHLEDVDASEVNVDTGSGNLDFTSPARLLLRLKAVTGSGAVHLHLPADVDFEAHAGLGSGRIQNRFPDADPIVRKRAIVGYRRGAGRIKIEVEMGSGSLLLEPRPRAEVP